MVTRSIVVAACVDVASSLQFASHASTRKDGGLWWPFTDPFGGWGHYTGDVNVGFCDLKSIKAARQRLANREYRELRGNSCVTDLILDELISGTRDPADNHEFLGDIDDEELSQMIQMHEDSDASIENADGSKIMPDQEAQHGYEVLLPKVLFIGLPHSGSTSLAMELNMHPEISFGQMKEHNMLHKYGVNKDAFLSAYGKAFLVNKSETKITFDGSPSTFFLGNPGDQEILQAPIGKAHGTGIDGAAAVRQLLGADLKLIFMARDPIDWQMSMKAAHGGDAALSSGSNLEKLTSNTSDLVHRACYADALKSWMTVFKRSNFMFIKSEEYFKNPDAQMQQVFSFLNVAPHMFRPADLQAQGRRRTARYATESTRKGYWKDQNVKDCSKRLQKLTKRSWSWGP